MEYVRVPKETLETILIKLNEVYEKMAKLEEAVKKRDREDEPLRM